VKYNENDMLPTLLIEGMSSLPRENTRVQMDSVSFLVRCFIAFALEAFLVRIASYADLRNGEAGLDLLFTGVLTDC
jgi:hypothetical protein